MKKVFIVWPSALVGAVVAVGESWSASLGVVADTTSGRMCLVAIVVSLVLAAILGLVTLKTREFVFSLVTYAAAVVAMPAVAVVFMVVMGVTAGLCAGTARYGLAAPFTLMPIMLGFLLAQPLELQDGHSQLVATTIPNCVAYDPAFACELAVIVQDGLRRMYAEREAVFYYITCMNENYAQPDLPEGAAQGVLCGGYRFAAYGPADGQRVTLDLDAAGHILVTGATIDAAVDCYGGGVVADPDKLTPGERSASTSPSTKAAR